MVRDIGEPAKIVERRPDQIVIRRPALLKPGDLPVKSVEEAAELTVLLAENA